MRARKSKERLKRQRSRLFDNTLMIEATEEALAALREMGYKIPLEPMPYTTFYEVQPPRGKTVEEALADFEQVGGVNDSVEFNTVMENAWLPDPENPQFVTQSEYLEILDINNIWTWMAAFRQSHFVHPVSVAVLEQTRYNIYHPNLWGTWDLPGFDGINNVDRDVNLIPGTAASSHPTAVSGVITAIPRANIGLAGLGFPAKVLPMFTSSSVTAARCIAKAIDRGCRVVNISQYGEQYEPFRQIVDECKARGIVVCVAAGNTGQGTIPDNPIGHYDSVICVSGLHHSNSREVTPQATYHADVDFCTPFRVPSLSVVNTWEMFGGTSGATPQVASLFALLFSIDPSLTWGDAVALVARNCIPEIPPAGIPEPLSYGIPQFMATLNELGGSTSGFYNSDRELIKQIILRQGGQNLYATGVYDHNKRLIWHPTFDKEEV